MVSKKFFDIKLMLNIKKNVLVKEKKIKGPNLRMIFLKALFVQHLFAIFFCFKKLANFVFGPYCFQLFFYFDL